MMYQTPPDPSGGVFSVHDVHGVQDKNYFFIFYIVIYIVIIYDMRKKKIYKK